MHGEFPCWIKRWIGPIKHRNLKRGFDTSNWDLIQESIDYLSEYIELNDDDETFDELNQ